MRDLMRHKVDIGCYSMNRILCVMCVLISLLLPISAFACGQESSRLIPSDPQQLLVMNVYYIIALLCIPLAVLRLRWPHSFSEFILTLKENSLFILLLFCLWTIYFLSQYLALQPSEGEKIRALIQFCFIGLTVMLVLSIFSGFREGRLGRPPQTILEVLNMLLQNSSRVLILFFFIAFLYLFSFSTMPHPIIPLLAVVALAIVGTACYRGKNLKEFRCLLCFLLLLTFCCPVVLKVTSGHFDIVYSRHNVDRWAVLDDYGR